MVDRLEPQTLDRRPEGDGLCLGGNEDEVAAYGLGQLRADGVGRNLIDRCDRTHRGGDAGPDRTGLERGRPTRFILPLSMALPIIAVALLSIFHVPTRSPFLSKVVQYRPAAPFCASVQIPSDVQTFTRVSGTTT